MSYEDTNCPCGDQKQRNTMLCETCETHFADHPSMVAFKDKKSPLDSRRHAAIVLVSLSRNRKNRRAK